MASPSPDARQRPRQRRIAMAERTLPNPERGCGHLKSGKAYIRGVIGSPDGILPSFVRAEPFVPYREMGTDGSFTRGYQQIAGVSAEAALEDQIGDGLTQFVPKYPGDASDEQAVTNMVDRGLYDVRDDVPDAEYQRHVDRIANRGVEGESHFGAVDAVRQSDLLMRAGKTHYPDPSDFVDEAIEMGISKAIPLSKRQEPPVIQPGGTRCWIVHPDTDDGWAVIGYGYIQEIVYTEPDDGNVPEYVQQYADAGRLDVVDFEDAPDDAEANGNATVDDFANTTDDTPPADDADGDADGADGSDAPDDTDDDEDADAGDTASVVVPDDRDNDQDVREVDPDDWVNVFLTTGADHVGAVDVDPATAFCGRDMSGNDATLHPADSGELVDDPTISVCGTCLSSLKARTNDEDDAEDHD